MKRVSNSSPTRTNEATINWLLNRDMDEIDGLSSYFIEKTTKPTTKSIVPIILSDSDDDNEVTIIRKPEVEDNKIHQLTLPTTPIIIIPTQQVPTLSLILPVKSPLISHTTTTNSIHP
jgi:hypothetical protein